MSRPVSRRRLLRPAVCLDAAILIALVANAAWAQVTPAAGYTPPDDTPSIKLGAVIFADYTYQQKPAATDADGNQINSSSFNVTRAYINVTGNVSHIVAFRITPDVVRASLPGTSLDGSITFRIKYAFAQINLDDWMWKGTWVRLGIQQTPYVDFMEGIYRYRFQGTIFPEREGYLSSSDAGASFRTLFPGNYGEIHAGIYNGENYNKPEANNQKAVQIRGTVRPLPMQPLLRGLRVNLFYDADNYVKNGPRRRGIFDVTFEHKYVHAGFDYMSTTDQPTVTKPAVDGAGWSVWVTPRTTKGFEGLLRYDSFKPDTGADARRKRTIAGIAYWFPHQGNVSAALLLDYEQVEFSSFVPAQPGQERFAVHGLVAF